MTLRDRIPLLTDRHGSIDSTSDQEYIYFMGTFRDIFNGHRVQLQIFAHESLENRLIFNELKFGYSKDY